MYTAKRGYRPGDEPVAGYHLTKFLGRGQFGEVWQAKAPGGMQVALKIIDLAEREGLKEFSGLLQVKDIRHANLVEFVACWVKTESGQVLDELPTDPMAALSPRDSAIEIGGTMLFDASGASPTRPVELIVAMSLGSKTLYRRLQEVNVGKEQKVWVGLPEDELLDYMEQAARGIDYLNQRGIIHGDIKPQNLLIVGDSVKVCDFGLARAVTNLRMTQSGMGTVAYAAPELFEGKPHIQSDQYCLAVSYIELRTGALPFEEPNPYKVIELHRHGRLDFGRLLRSEQGVVRRATEIRPDRRWPTCTEMVRKLREVRQQERAGGGRGWFSFLRSKPDLAVTQPSPPPPPGPAADEPADAQPDADLAAKKDSGRGAPGKKDSGKKDSGKKKSGPQSPAAARAVQTVRRRGDETDSIAETMPSEDVPPVPRRTGPSAARRIAKVCAWLCILGAIGAGAYVYLVPYLNRRLPPAVVDEAGEKADRKDDGRKGDRDKLPPLEAAKSRLLEAVRKGDFRTAGDEGSKAKGQLVVLEYEEFTKTCREWSEVSTNVALQQLAAKEIDAPTAARRFKDADAEDSFVKLAGRVPEGVWQAVLELWTKDFDAQVTEGKFREAAAVVIGARQDLLAERYEQLQSGIQKAWGQPATNRVLQCLKESGITARDAAVRLKTADAEENFVKLAGRVPAGVWQAVLEKWMKDFDQLLVKELEKAVEEWKAVNKWQDAPSELISPEARKSLRGRIQNQWKMKRWDPYLMKEDFRSAKAEIDSPLVKDIFEGTELDAVRSEVRPKWKAHFDDLLKAPEGVAKASEELKEFGKYFDSQEEYSQKAAQIGKVWGSGLRSLAEQGQWEAAKKLYDSAPEDIIPAAERDKELEGVRTALDKRLGQSLAPPLDERKLNEAIQTLASVERANLFPQSEIDKLREPILQNRRQKWIAAFDGALKKKDWAEAKAMIDGAPAGLFPKTDLDKKLARIQADWGLAFDALVGQADWDAAKKVLDSPPEGLFSASELQERQGQFEAEWTKQFKSLTEKKDWDGAKKSLDYALVKLFPKSPGIENLRDVIERGRRGMEMDALDKSITELLDANKFAEAKEKLDAAVAKDKSLQEKAASWEKELRRRWFPWIRSNWDKSDQAEAFKAQVAGFLKASPEPAEANDARLLLARLLVRLGTEAKSEQDLKAAQDALQALKAVDFPADQACVRDVLEVIVKLKPRDKLPEPSPKLAAPWELTRWELASIPPLMPSPPSTPTGMPALATIREALKSPRQLLPLVEKQFPAEKPDAWTVTEADDVRLVTREAPSALERLASIPAYAEQAKDLARAAAWLQAAQAKFSGRAEISKALYEVLVRRLALRVDEPQGPSQEDWGLISQWDRLRKERPGGPSKAGDELLAKAWHVECMLALGKETDSVRDHLDLIRGDLLKAQPAYGHYLSCRALRAVAKPDWKEIVRELNELVPALEGPDPTLKAQDRAGAVLGLIVEAAKEPRERARPWKTLDRIPFNPFADKAEAEQYARLLKAARKFPGAGENRELKASLVLAACHQEKPEGELAWTLTSELPLRDTSMQDGLLPLLFAGVSSFWQQPKLARLAADDPQFVAGIRATTQLLQEFGKDEAGRISKEGAAAVYNLVLKPVLESPALEAAAKKKEANAPISDLSGATAKFLIGQADVKWPLPDSASVYQVIEKQASRAIELTAKDKPEPARLAEYYAVRGEARAYADFSATEVLSDTDEAVKLRADLHTALGTRAYALIMRAQERAKRDEILKDLEEAIASGEAARAKCPTSDKKRLAGYMMNVANAHLWLGNCEADPAEKQKHFDLARNLVGEATRTEQDHGDNARLLLGNIYEDLASQVGTNAEKDYNEAVRQFEQVLKENEFSAQGLCSLARCRYKAVTNANLKLGLRDRDAVLTKCREDLEKAVQYSVEPRVRIESLCYLGLVCQEQGDWEKADENVAKAVGAAKQSKASSQAVYAYQSALVPYSHAMRLLKTKPGDPNIGELFKKAESRAEELKKMPPGGRVIPAKDAPYLQGLVRSGRKDYKAAVEAFGAGLPKDLAQADALDVKLLLARAACNLARCIDSDGRTFVAQSADWARASLPDAVRASKLATTPREQADACYWQANAHVILSLEDGANKTKEADDLVTNIREAVRLTQLGAAAIKYRYEGASLFIRAAQIYAANDRRQDAAAVLKEAKGWLEQALEREEDPKEKNKISARLKVIEKQLADLAAPPAES